MAGVYQNRRQTMNQLERAQPAFCELSISLHDRQITRISCNSQSTVFHFNKGFTLIHNNDALTTNAGYIELHGYDCNEFSCHIIKRYPTRKGARLQGLPITLKELDQLLVKKKQYIELYLELYDDNHFYWRGELLPHKRPFSRRQLAPIVVIETMGFPKMIYSWE